MTDRPVVSAQDLGVFFSLPFMVAVSWLTSEPTWRSIANRAAPFASAMLSRNQIALSNRIREFAGQRQLPLAPEDAALQIVANEIEAAFQVVRDHSPVEWRPDICIDGEEHLIAALSRGKGVILWVSHFSFASLMTKMGLHRKGYLLNHLSRQEHGFSPTHLGIHVLNPVCTMTERRYLASRIVMPEKNPGTVLEDLASLLHTNQVVSITVRSNSNQPVEAAFLDGTLRVAPGAPVLARNTDAALLPVFTKRIDGCRYCVRVDKPIDLSAAPTRREAVISAVNEYTGRLEDEVLEHPGQWIEWINI